MIKTFINETNIKDWARNHIRIMDNSFSQIDYFLTPSELFERFQKDYEIQSLSNTQEQKRFIEIFTNVCCPEFGQYQDEPIPRFTGIQFKKDN